MEHLSPDIARRYAVGDLPPRTRVRWHSHLLTCETCRELVREEQRLVGLLKLDDPVPADPAALERMLERVHHETGPGSAVTGRLPALAAALVAGALIGLLLALLLPQPATPAASATLPPPLQREIIRELPALEALARDPWLEHEYQTVVWLHRLITAEAP